MKYSQSGILPLFLVSKNVSKIRSPKQGCPDTALVSTVPGLHSCSCPPHGSFLVSLYKQVTADDSEDTGKGEPSFMIGGSAK